MIYNVVFLIGLYVENFIDVAKRELAEECDYLREAECSTKFRSVILLKNADKIRLLVTLSLLCLGFGKIALK